MRSCLGILASRWRETASDVSLTSVATNLPFSAHNREISRGAPDASLERKSVSRQRLVAVTFISLLGWVGCKHAGTDSEASSRADEANRAKILAANAASCFTPINEAECVNVVPTTVPDATFLCLAVYLKVAPKIDFSQSAATVYSMDFFRERGQDVIAGKPVQIGDKTDSGLHFLLKKHFTYKRCSDKKRYTYEAAALGAGLKASDEDGTIGAILSTTRMSKKGAANRAKAEAGASDPATLAKVKFALDNLICIRNAADSPCNGQYPKYLPITSVSNITMNYTTVRNIIGTVLVPNKAITLLPGLDNSQKADLKAHGIVSENFAARTSLIGRAKSILISSWQIKDKDGDTSGPKLSRAIADSKRNGGTSFVLGNFSTSIGNGFFSQDFVREGSIPGARMWAAGKNRSYTYHRKLTILNDDTVIFGGKNYADEYMQQHFNSKDWRDTDVMIVDPQAAKIAKYLFASDWVNNGGKLGSNNRGPDILAGRMNQACSPTPGSSCFKFITHDPARQDSQGDEIFTAMVQAIHNATETVDIENAYVIASAPLVSALYDAAKKGVRIRILTNSAQSIDVPELGHVMNLNATAIVKNEHNKVHHRVKVYLKKLGSTSTLHSKFGSIAESVGDDSV
jgi:hypothetical protein